MVNAHIIYRSLVEQEAETDMISRFEWLLIIFGIGIVQILCFWGIDVSVSAMLTTDAVLTNGFNIQSPLTIYHLCLYVSILASIATIIIAVHIIEKFTRYKVKQTRSPSR